MAKDPRSMPQVATKHEIATSRVNLPVDVPVNLWASTSIHKLPEFSQSYFRVVWVLSSQLVKRWDEQCVTD